MVNKVTLLGNIGKDAEKVSENVTKFSVATTEYWKDNQTGERKSKTEWHRVVVLGKLAPVMADLCKSGKMAYVEGKLQTSEWTTKEGEKRYSTEVIVDFGGNIKVINTEKSEGSPYTPPADSSNATPSSSKPAKEKTAPVRETPREQALASTHDDDAGHDFVEPNNTDKADDDDIPF